jgi:hypothetical protein
LKNTSSRSLPAPFGTSPATVLDRGHGLVEPPGVVLPVALSTSDQASATGVSAARFRATSSPTRCISLFHSFVHLVRVDAVALQLGLDLLHDGAIASKSAWRRLCHFS